MIFDKHIFEIKDLIKAHYSDSELLEESIQVNETRKEFVGDWTVIVFSLTRFSKKNVLETANELGNLIVNKLDYVSSFNVVKGFLNLEFSNIFWFDALQYSFSDSFEVNKNKNKNIVVEFSSPNTNKPLHLGHLRNILLGHSISNILEANGNNVKRVQIINDRGIHICKSMLAWLKFGNGETPESSQLKGDYLVGKYYVLFDRMYQQEIKNLLKEGYSLEEAGTQSALLNEAKEMLIKWENGDSGIIELWKKMNSWVYKGFNETYQKIGVRFDKNYYESQTYLLGKKFIENGVENNIFYANKDSSIWVNLDDHNLDAKLLQRSDGTAVYMTQDIGTAIIRKDELDFDSMIYVVGNEQNHHFNVLFKILEKMGFSWSNNLTHMSYGMVNLPDGKMKSREGNVVDIDDLIDMMYKKSNALIKETGKVEDNYIPKLSQVVADGALKYFILKPDAKKEILFNPEDSIDFNGHTGPFIQYTYARIQSILKNASNFNRLFILDRDLLIQEISLIKLILNYPVILNQAAVNCNPSFLANYLYSLSKEYNQFYQKNSILNLKDQNDINFRVTISEKVSILINSGMNLLGIEMPLKM